MTSYFKINSGRTAVKDGRICGAGSLIANYLSFLLKYLSKLSLRCENSENHLANEPFVMLKKMDQKLKINYIIWSTIDDNI